MISKYLAMGRKICRDDLSKIENYDKAMADTTQKWECHHRLETHRYTDRTRTSWEIREEYISKSELIAFNVYFNRPAEELIFLPPDEHRKLHREGKKRSEETVRKVSEALKGRKLSEEHRRKMSEFRKGNKYTLGYHHTEESKQKMSAARKGKPKTEETKRKMSEAAKARWARRKKEERENDTAAAD